MERPRRRPGRGRGAPPPESDRCGPGRSRTHRSQTDPGVSRRSRRALGVVAALASLALFPALPTTPTAHAYRLKHTARTVAGEAGAYRWPAADLPVRFHLLENDSLPAEVFPDHGPWRAVVEDTFRQWNEVETATTVLALERDHLMQMEASGSDGRNTIGFSSYFARNDFPYSGFAAWQFTGGRIASCDVELNPVHRVDAPWETPPEALDRLLLHEIGHCLGLLHSVELPMPFDYGLPLDLAGFDSDPIMSYGRQRAFLTPDDEVAVSLLYPAPGFRQSTGSITGTLRFRDGEPARFAYVQVFEIGGKDRGEDREGQSAANGARAGPGAFADRNGLFLVEGVRPGPVLLWVHPFVIAISHGFDRDAGEWATRFPHVWTFTEARPGETTSVGEVGIRRNREERPSG